MVGRKKIFAWNCRGARSGDFLREMKEFLRQERPIIILLLEPRISGIVADEICNKLGRNKWIQSDAEGFSVGVWCLWNEDEVSVKLRYAHNYFLHLLLATAGGKKWDEGGVCPTECHKKDGFLGEIVGAEG